MKTSYVPRWSPGFSSLADEYTIASLTTTGTIPEQLSGTLYLIGPGRFELGSRPVGHWLDGFAMVSSISFGPRGIKFSNRFLATSWYRHALIEDTTPAGGFDSPIPHRSNRRSPDNTNLNIVTWMGRLEALGDMPQRVVVDAGTLATIQTTTPKQMSRSVASSPHPFFDKTTGERFDLALVAGDPSGYDIIVTKVEGVPQRLAFISSSRLGYIHSFGVTARWIVLVEGPFTANPRSLRSRRRPYLRNYVWDASRGTRIFVVDRKTGALEATLSTRPLFSLHHINAWEDGDQLVTDIAAYADPSILDALAFDNGQIRPGDFPAPLATRLVINPATSKVACLPLKCPPGEFWRIDDRFSMRPATVLFSVGPSRTGGFVDRILRSDLTTGQYVQWSSDNCFPGAPAFVPSNENGGEGEGWLLSIVLDAAAQRSFVLILEASTLTEIGRAWLPCTLPFGLHTLFLPGESST